MQRRTLFLGAVLGAAWVASASAAPERTTSASAQEVRAEGEALFAKGQFEEALHKYQVAWVLDRAPVDLLRIGRCRYKLGELRAAKDVLFRFLQLDPTSEHAPEAFDIISQIEKGETAARPAPEVMVDFGSDPAGASVEIENQVVCEATPCSKPVPEGRYLVAMQKEGYEPAVEAFSAKGGARVNLKLPRLEGQVSLTSEPSGLVVSLDGRPAGRTPLLIDKVAAARHEVAIEDGCYQRASETFELKKDERKSVKLVLRPRETELKLHATDDAGRPIAGTALLRGQRLGSVPGTHRVWICEKSLKVQSGNTSIEQLLRLDDQSADLTFRLPVARCDRITRENRIAGWTTVVGLLAGSASMGGAWAIHNSVLDAPAGEPGLRSKATFGKVLNVLGIAGLAAAGGGLVALNLLPTSASACVRSQP